jgi:hypothetical protein
LSKNVKHLIVSFLLLSLIGLSSLYGEEEYWKDFFYLIDGSSFDKAPLFYHPITKREAESMGNYTVVYLNELGIMSEAITYQGREPLYYYYYLYDGNSHPLARVSYYFQQADKAMRNSLVYFYYCENRLCATSYFEYSLLIPGEKMRTFSKVYDAERQGRFVSEIDLLRMSDLVALMEKTENKVDETMTGFQGGELFQKRLVK